MAELAQLTGLFNQLTPEHVLDAVETKSRRCTGRFIILNSYENRVYQLELDDESWVVGKFYRPGRWSFDTIMAEHNFLKELDREEVPVISPIELDSGGTIGDVDGIMFSIFPRVGGRAPDEPNEEQLTVLGRLLARIHNIGDARTTTNRMHLTPETYGTNNLEFLTKNDFIPPEALENYTLTVQQIIEHITPMFEGIPVHRIHGDCHQGNLLWSNNGASFLDFDDMVTGPAVQDVWMMIPSYDKYGQQQRELFLEAYGQFRDFDPTWLRLIEPLRALRFIHYSTWIAKRWTDPIFKKVFSHFGTLQYWQQEIQDLREQLGRITTQIWG